MGKIYLSEKLSISLNRELRRIVVASMITEQNGNHRVNEIIGLFKTEAQGSRGGRKTGILVLREGVSERCRNRNTDLKSHHSDLVMLSNIVPLDLQ